MNAAKFAAIRRRVLDDALFRAGLRTDFARTLAQEGLLAELSAAQRDDLHLALLLHDAMRMRDQRRTEQAGPVEPAVVEAAPEPAPWVERTVKLRSLPPSPRSAPARTPVDIGAWRARRAR